MKHEVDCYGYFTKIGLSSTTIIFILSAIDVTFLTYQPIKTSSYLQNGTFEVAMRYLLFK